MGRELVRLASTSAGHVAGALSRALGSRERTVVVARREPCRPCVPGTSLAARCPDRHGHGGGQDGHRSTADDRLADGEAVTRGVLGRPHGHRSAARCGWRRPVHVVRIADVHAWRGRRHGAPLLHHQPARCRVSLLRPEGGAADRDVEPRLEADGRVQPDSLGAQAPGLVTRCILFDFGNVIALFDHMIACRRLASLSRPALDPQDVYVRIFNTTLEEDYDCGRLSSAAFVDRLRHDLSVEASDEVIAEAWCDIYAANPVIQDLILEEKRRGTRLVLASNTNELHFQWFSRQFEPVLRLFDELVLSFRVGARKPAVQFFDACIRASGRPAEQIIYIDDRRDYVAAGRALGMQSFVYDPALPPPAF